MRVALIAMSSLLVLGACGDDDPTPAQTDAPDTSGETTPDSAEPDDSDADDTDADDTEDTTPNDADDTADTSPNDADDTADVPDTSCEYFEERELLRCGPNDSITQVLRWISVDAAACPPYYTRGEDRYETEVTPHIPEDIIGACLAHHVGDVVDLAVELGDAVDLDAAVDRERRVNAIQLDSRYVWRKVRREEALLRFANAVSA